MKFLRGVKDARQLTESAIKTFPPNSVYSDSGETTKGHKQKWKEYVKRINDDRLYEQTLKY